MQCNAICNIKGSLKGENGRGNGMVVDMVATFF